MTAPAYILTADDVEDGRNRLGMDVRHLPLGVPLCSACDGEIVDGYCGGCEEQIVEVEQIAPGRIAA